MLWAIVYYWGSQRIEMGLAFSDYREAVTELQQVQRSRPELQATLVQTPSDIPSSWAVMHGAAK